MKQEFRIDGVNYMVTEKGYYYKAENGKKIRIKKQEFEDAFEDLCGRTDEQLDLYVEQSGLDEMDDWAKGVQEMEAAKEAHKKEQEASDKQAEDAINGKSKPKKKRKSKDIAFEMNTYDDDLQKSSITLTAKQVLFMQAMPEDDFWEHGLDSALWIDVFADTVAGIFSPMAVGAMVSTLREKGILAVGVEKMNGKKCKFMELTALGKDVAKEMGLN